MHHHRSGGRILVGDDVHKLDAGVRPTPDEAYTPEFFKSFTAEVGWLGGVEGLSGKRASLHFDLILRGASL